jgi:hypothetical protein
MNYCASGYNITHELLMLVHLLFLSKGDYLKMLKLNVNVCIQIAVTKLSYKFKVDMSFG